jgi:hypothetical protein
LKFGGEGVARPSLREHGSCGGRTQPIDVGVALLQHAVEAFDLTLERHERGPDVVETAADLVVLLGALLVPESSAKSGEMIERILEPLARFVLDHEVTRQSELDSSRDAMRVSMESVRERSRAALKRRAT